jgi:hypothetical protein
VETLPFAVELPGEKVIVKQAFDGFQNPELCQYLQGRGKRFLLTAGLVTRLVSCLPRPARRKVFLPLSSRTAAPTGLLHERTLETYQFIFYAQRRVSIERLYEVACRSGSFDLEEGKYSTKESTML